MYKIIVLAIFVAVANCNNLDKLSGAWYPLAFFLPGEDLSSVYQVCHSNVYAKSDQTFSCGRFNITGGLSADFGDGTTFTVPAIVVETYRDVTRTMNLLKGCPTLNIFRFVGKYLIAYNNFVTESEISMYLLSQEVPTQRDLDDFIEMVPELERSEDESVVCTQEVMTATNDKRGSRDPKKNTSPQKILQNKLFARH